MGKETRAFMTGSTSDVLRSALPNDHGEAQDRCQRAREEAEAETEALSLQAGQVPQRPLLGGVEVAPHHRRRDVAAEQQQEGAEDESQSRHRDRVLESQLL